jgi:predicted amidophosphoribosyltransferase
MTTGTSLNELAKTVMNAGAQSCDVLTLSRAMVVEDQALIGALSL